MGMCYMQGEDDTVNTNKCKTKVATFESQLENYKEAADIFEGIATYMADERLLHWSAKVSDASFLFLFFMYWILLKKIHILFSCALGTG